MHTTHVLVHICAIYQKRKRKNAHENSERVVYKEIVKENPLFEKYYKVYSCNLLLQLCMMVYLGTENCN